MDIIVQARNLFLFATISKMKIIVNMMEMFSVDVSGILGRGVGKLNVMSFLPVIVKVTVDVCFCMILVKETLIYVDKPLT
jgi:hypothetical protein